MGAAATALKAIIVIWVKFPGPGDDLVLDRQYEIGTHHLWPYEVVAPRRQRLRGFSCEGISNIGYIISAFYPCHIHTSGRSLLNLFRDRGG